MDNKNIRFFMSGFLAGTAFIFLLIFIPAYLSRGNEITRMKTFGNIKITPFEVDPKILLGVGESLVIQKDQEPVLTLYFNYEKQLTDLNFLNDEKPLFSASMSKDLKDWQFFDYGDYETGAVYYDKNCDGMFDTCGMGKDRFIFFNKEWVKIDDIKKDGTAVVDNENTRREFVFDKENSWVEKTQDPNKIPEPNEPRSETE